MWNLNTLKYVICVYLFNSLVYGSGGVLVCVCVCMHEHVCVCIGGCLVSSITVYIIIIITIIIIYNNILLLLLFSFQMVSH